MLGFLTKKDLEQILDPKYLDELIALMEKFEIIIFLDNERLVIPSLLPPDKSMSCPVFSRTANPVNIEDSLSSWFQNAPHTAITDLPHPVLVRYYLLPFVPNGFFARVIARFMSTNMIEYIQKSLQSGPLDDGLTNQAHWKCWRDGIIIVWHHMEIFRIAPVTFPLPGTTRTRLISSGGDKPVETSKGVEIKVAVLPEEVCARSNAFPTEHEQLNSHASNYCRATWLFHQATTIVNSVFEDWYEVFATDQTFDLMNLMGNTCSGCFKAVYNSDCGRGLPRRDAKKGKASHTPTSPQRDKDFYMFTSPYCARAVAEGRLELDCPSHGLVHINDIAPDLAFNDFPPSLVFTDPECLMVSESPIGGGGFGSVFKGTLTQVCCYNLSALTVVHKIP